MLRTCKQKLVRRRFVTYLNTLQTKTEKSILRPWNYFIPRLRKEISYFRFNFRVYVISVFEAKNRVGKY